MIYNERELRPEIVRTLAEAVMAAARTAPKAKGRDLVEIAMVTDEDVERLSVAMRELSEESGLKFLLRDAENILHAQAMILIGTREAQTVCGLNCGYCGYATCVGTKKRRHSSHRRSHQSSSFMRRIFAPTAESFSARCS